MAEAYAISRFNSAQVDMQELANLHLVPFMPIGLPINTHIILVHYETSSVHPTGVPGLDGRPMSPVWNHVHLSLFITSGPRLLQDEDFFGFGGYPETEMQRE